MGFLKRLFSIGGKKNSKSKQAKESTNTSSPLTNAKRASGYNTIAGAPYTSSATVIQEQGIEEEDHEAAVHRLLRTSSARYAVVNEVDHSDMPPMPHPINAVLQAQNYAEVQKQSTGHSMLGPSTSTVSLSSTTMNTRGGTYNVTVYRKQRLSHGPEEVLATERKKNRDSAHLNANDSRTLKLRCEPSVVSLLSLYDDQGRLPDGAFSNDISDAIEQPPTKNYKEVPMASEDDEAVAIGKAQCKRSGSTLRQLLGAETDGKPADASEGDISWAERFLGELESSSTSTHSSLMLPTPVSEYGPPDTSEIVDTTIDNPAISSMEVELSISTDASEMFGDEFSFGEIKKTPSYESSLNGVGKTPTNKPMNLTHNSSIGRGTPHRRASQVFEFIKKRASKFVEKDERDLAEPPSAFSSPSSVGHDARSFQDIQSQRSRASSEQDNQDEAEVDRHLKSRFSSEESCESAFGKEKNDALHLFATDATPRDPKKRPASEAAEMVREGGLDQVKGLIKRLSFNLGSRDGEQERPEPAKSVAPAWGAIVAETPMRPAADAAKQERDVRVLMTGPTKVIVTAPTPGTAYYTQTGYSLSRVPRGPRGHNSRRRTSGSSRFTTLGVAREEKPGKGTEERRRNRQERAERDNVKKEREEKYRHGLTTNIISTPRKKAPTRTSSGRSTLSVSSIGSNENTQTGYGAVYAEAKRFVEGGGSGKTTTMGLSVKADIPLTPLRTSRRTSVNQDAFFQAPQPTAVRGGKLSTTMGLSPEEAKDKRRGEREKGLYALPAVRSGRAARSNRA